MFDGLTGFYKSTSGRLRLSDALRDERRLEALSIHRVRRDPHVVRTFPNIRLFPQMTLLENLIVAQHNTLHAASKFPIAALFALPGYHVARKKSIKTANTSLQRLTHEQFAHGAGDLQNRDHGMTILLVEQNANQALRVAHRGYVLQHGEITLATTGAERLARPEVRATYLEGGHA